MSLTVQDTAQRATYLTLHSGLPGPRANLALAGVYAEVADVDEAVDFSAADDEYLALCGTLALGARSEDPSIADLVRALALDERWRVREGVALGLQRLGAVDPLAMLTVLDDWRSDPHPLLQRARVATIADPQLLTNPALATAALRICSEATDQLLRLSLPERRERDPRVLRTTLGWGWSIAVAADPAAGLPAFEVLAETDDPDVRWIVRHNRERSRLKSLLA